MVLEFSPFLQDIYNIIYTLNVELKKFPRNISQNNTPLGTAITSVFKLMVELVTQKVPEWE